MNVVTLSGRLTKDPETRYTQTGTAVTSISIAVDRHYKSEGQPDTDFFNCTAFGKRGENLGQFFHKGSRIIISGSMQNETYTNREGQKVTATRVIIDQFDFIDTKSESQARAAAQPAPTNAADAGFMNIPDDVDDAELPFN